MSYYTDISGNPTADVYTQNIGRLPYKGGYTRTLNTNPNSAPNEHRVSGRAVHPYDLTQIKSRKDREQGWKFVILDDRGIMTTFTLSDPNDHPPDAIQLGYKLPNESIPTKIQTWSWALATRNSVVCRDGLECQFTEIERTDRTMIAPLKAGMLVYIDKTNCVKAAYKHEISDARLVIALVNKKNGDCVTMQMVEQPLYFYQQPALTHRVYGKPYMEPGQTISTSTNHILTETTRVARILLTAKKNQQLATNFTDKDVMESMKLQVEQSLARECFNVMISGTSTPTKLEATDSNMLIFKYFVAIFSNSTDVFMRILSSNIDMASTDQGTVCGWIKSKPTLHADVATLAGWYSGAWAVMENLKTVLLLKKIEVQKMEELDMTTDVPQLCWEIISNAIPTIIPPPPTAP